MKYEGINIVALVGMPGAGKSSCVEYLEKLGFPSVYFGGITIDEVKNRGLQVNAENEKMVREDIRAKEGLGAYAERILKKIDELIANGHTKIVADGLYSWSEYKIFKQHFGAQATIIALAAPRHIRHERLAKRPIRPLSDQEVTDREYAEIENLEKGGPIANADYTIVNDNHQDQMIEDLNEVLKEINFI